jgi:FkbM family methyltransferase
MKQLVKSLARSCGYEIRSINRSPPNLIDFLDSRQVDLVFDVGANIGQFAMGLRQLGYTGDIVSFEPVRSAFDILQQNAAADPKWVAYNLGLGERAEEVNIQVSEATVYSSILPQTDEAVRFDSRTRTVRVEKITLTTLDEIARPFVGRNPFLKVDTQGFERQVLAGAKEMLKTLKGVQLEVPIVHLYRNTWTLREAIDRMAEEGFIISQIAPVIFCVTDPVSFMEIDCVFRPTNSRT